MPTHPHRTTSSLVGLCPALPTALCRLALALLVLTVVAPAEAATTFPTDCGLHPNDCAGVALANRYGTNGLNDNPRRFNPAVHPPVEKMFRVTMDLQTYPDAMCNDGSPAVFYFAAAPAGSINADNWVIQLEGGGSCLSAQDEDGLHQDCMDRWTGRGPDRLDYPRKMSTDLDGDGVVDLAFLPLEGRVPGLLGAASVVTDPTDNGGADAWNRLYLNYCSSDLWRGRSGSQVLDDGEWTDAAGGTQIYEPLDNAYFHGHWILDNILDAVAAGVTSDDGDHFLRLDTTPDKVVLAGESAGGGGVIANLDYLAGKALWGDGVTKGVAGATTVPPLAYDDVAIPWYTGPQTVQEWDLSVPVLVDVDLDANGVIDTHDREAGTALRRNVYETILDAFVDQSCAAANTDPLAPDPNQRHWLCHTAVPLFEDGHITTEILIKQDLADSVMSAGIPAFGEGVRTTMGSTPANFYYFGPKCGHHETLSNTSRFKGDRVTDPVVGRTVSYHTAIAEFIDGLYTSIYHQPGVTIRSCAP
ncbi:MAG: pectin acetylesterase-family hydrolase [Acidobacteriota bacterium]